jgi:hypothetical protein
MPGNVFQFTGVEQIPDHPKFVFTNLVVIGIQRFSKLKFIEADQCRLLVEIGKIVRKNSFNP